jgi:hypothetical protein
MDQIKTTIENHVMACLSERMGPGAAIVTNKYLTPTNEFVYLTHTSVSDNSLPTIKIQVFRRVEGGVRETGYSLYSDERFDRYDNAMIFGQAKAAGESLQAAPVSEAEAQDVLTLVQSLKPEYLRV